MKTLQSIDKSYDIIDDEIGQGAYGQVMKGRCQKTGKIVAMKKITRNNTKEGFPITTVREIILLKEVKCDYVVELIDVVTDNSRNVYLIFDYAEYDLDYILRRIELTERQVISFMAQLLFGLYALHKRCIFHRDLKPQNILVKASNLVQIADFGLAKQQDPKTKNKRMTYNVITLFYRPLELFFKANEYKKNVDIWSLGCIFYEMIKHRPLFYTSDVSQDKTDEKNEMLVVQQIFKICGYPDEKDWPDWKKYPQAELYASAKVESTGNLNDFLSRELPEKYQPCKRLLLGMLQYDPKKRLKIKDLIADSYFASAEFNFLDYKSLPTIKVPPKGEKNKLVEDKKQKRMADEHRPTMKKPMPI